MMKHLLLCLVLLTLTLMARAQHRCASTDAAQALELRQPGSAAHLQRLEIAVHDWVAETGGMHEGADNRWPSVTIPVVVHIVYNTPAQNITDAQVQSQIDVLNEDFRRLNADTIKTRNIFRPFAADTKIQFCLAARDPSGAATIGITRTSTDTIGFTYNDDMKFGISGGIDAWDPAHYLNIWVCNLTSANGYAYYPNIQPAYDGVVVNYNVFGRIGPVVPPYDLGRTTTHEVGHWLGLYHPFEGFFAGTGCGGSDTLTCASMGDHLCDTPGDITPSYGCDTTENSCADTPVDYPDQIENYMDYADDNCVNMFSVDQAARMNGFLYTARRSLLTSMGCAAPGANVLDVAVTAIDAPVGQTCNGTVTPRITLYNLSSQALTSLTISYRIDGGPAVVTNWTGAIPQAASASLTLTPSTVGASGMHQLEVTVSDPNGGSDTNPNNDRFDAPFELVLAPPTFIMGATQGFETAQFPPTGWRIDNPDHNYYTWERSSLANGNLAPGSNAIKINNFYLGSDNTTDAFITEVFETSDDFILIWNYAYMAPASPFYSDTLKVYLSHDCGDTWTLLREQGGNLLATVPNSGFAPYVPGPNEWQTGILEFWPGAISMNWQFKFENVSGWGNDLWIDNIIYSVAIGADPTAPIAGLSLHPNPAGDALWLDLGGDLLPTGSVEIISSLGQSIRHIAVPEGQTRLSVEVQDLSPGIYSLRYLTAAGGMGTRQFVKQ
jgi:hypothetical protein